MIHTYYDVDGNIVKQDVEPDPPYVPPEPTAEEISLELHADHEYRLCMIELGLK